jgi:NAD-dependent dihydropyrimidine dehydrogenase PreA subunit
MELLVYLVPILLALGIYSWRRHRLHQRNLSVHQEALQAGLSEPATLHPIVDPRICIGCGSCVKACPEHQVLGMISGKAQLIGPADCIGHGACRVACPVGAITLVFGTATRGVDLPRVTPWFETNVSGIFVAGELGGMGLIRNAIEQGRQAVEQIHERRPRGGKDLDLVIIGAGPPDFQRRWRHSSAACVS